MSEGEEGVVRYVEIARHILHLHVARVSRVSVLDGAASRELVIVERLLPHSAGETHGELAAGRYVPKEGTGDCGSSLYPREPDLHDCRHMPSGPVEHQRAAGEDEQDDRLAGGDHRLKQLLLVPRQFEVSTRRGFTTHVARLAQGED